MKPQDIRIVMAEIDGWTLRWVKMKHGGYWDLKDSTELTIWESHRDYGFDRAKVWEEIFKSNTTPNYPEDLNAIAEFKKKHIVGHEVECSYATHFLRILRREFNYEYEQLCLVDTVIFASRLDPIFDCEALIKTLALEKWKE